MDNLKNDHYYIDRIKQDLQFIVMHMKNVTIADLSSLYLLQNAPKTPPNVLKNKQFWYLSMIQFWVQ